MNRFGNASDYREEHKKIIAFARALRSIKDQRQTDWRDAAEWHMKYSFLNGRKVLALTITLSPVGCQWARTGGCTMCGEFEGADRRLKILSNPQFHISQFARAISNPEVWKAAENVKSQIRWLRIFQEGNFINDEEINVSAQETILRLASKVKGVERITIEARPQYITENVVKRLSKIFVDSDVELEIGMGVEAVDDVIRNVCVNKGDSLKDFERAVELLNRYNILPLAYILVKPPFLSEREAIDEAVFTAQYATKIGFKRISFEPMSIHAYSLVDALFQCGEYRVPWLWSVIEIAKRCYDSGVVDFGIGGIGFYPLPTTFSHNYCTGKTIRTECNDNVIKAIIRYNSTHNISHLRNLRPCKSCYDLWKKECNTIHADNLKDRIIRQLASVEPIINNYKPHPVCEGQDIKIHTLIASGSQTTNLNIENCYEWLDNEFNEPNFQGIGFSQFLADSPRKNTQHTRVEANNSIIREFQSACLNVLKKAINEQDTELIKWLMNDTPNSMGIEYLKKLPEKFGSTSISVNT